MLGVPRMVPSHQKTDGIRRGPGA